MDSKNLLNEWYGFDKKVKSVGVSYPVSFITTEPSDFDTSTFKMPQNLLEEINKRYTDAGDVLKAVQLYFPASDGLTDEDFLNLLDSGPTLSGLDGMWGKRNWRVIQTLKGNQFIDDYSFEELVRSFYTADEPRSDRIFRSIELNEFLHRGRDEQTLQDFLLTDTEYEDKCREFALKQYSDLTNTLINYISAMFLEFGTQVTLKTRQLLLPLTVTELKKVLDFENNPYADSNPENSHTFEFAEIYIKAALGQIQRIIIPPLTPVEISNAIFLELFSGPREYWEKRSKERGMTYTVNSIMQYIRSIDSNSETFTRHFAYLVSQDVLRNLNPIELVSVIVGYNKSRLWAQQSKGKTTLELATELMYEGKLDPLMFCKIIAHILINNLDPIVIDKDFDWATIDPNTPIEWIYESLPHSKIKKLTSRPPVLKNLAP